jgi:hypothetical protein
VYRCLGGFGVCWIHIYAEIRICIDTYEWVEVGPTHLSQRQLARAGGVDCIEDAGDHGQCVFSLELLVRLMDLGDGFNI